MDQTAHPNGVIDNNNATPTVERCVTAYPARRGYKPYIVKAQSVDAVEGFIDIHCHAGHNQQDAFLLAQLASESGMYGILYKGIQHGKRPPGGGPMDDIRLLKEDLARWADKTGVRPIEAWGGYTLCRDSKPPNAKKVIDAAATGVTCFWLALANHANTYSVVGGLKRRWDPNAHPKDHSVPLPWELAVKYGQFGLDENGKLRKDYEEAVRAITDHNCTLSFGHSTHPEIYALAELVDKLNFKRAFIDHPFSPFVNLTVAQMKELSKVGITFNFTYDELSPMQGVDPRKMYDAIRAVGVQHCTLSSDAGDTIFPNTAECMRQISAYMAAFGMNAEEIETLCVRNPARLCGEDPDKVVREVRARAGKAATVN